MKKMYKNRLKEFALSKSDFGDNLQTVYDNYYILADCPMSQSMFFDKAEGWSFFGTDEGGVITRIQNSGLIKLIAVYGTKRQIGNGLHDMYAYPNSGVWGLIDQESYEEIEKLTPKKIITVGGHFILSFEDVFDGILPLSNMTIQNKSDIVKVNLGGCVASQVLCMDGKYLDFLSQITNLNTVQKDKLNLVRQINGI